MGNDNEVDHGASNSGNNLSSLDSEGLSLEDEKLENTDRAGKAVVELDEESGSSNSSVSGDDQLDAQTPSKKVASAAKAEMVQQLQSPKSVMPHETKGADREVAVSNKRRCKMHDRETDTPGTRTENLEALIATFEIESLPVPPPRRADSTPGAYAEAGRPRFARPFSMAVHQSQTSSDDSGPLTLGVPDDHSELVEASLVGECQDADLLEAQPVDGEARLKRIREREQEKRRFCIRILLLFFLGAVVAFVIVGVVVANTAQSEHSKTTQVDDRDEPISNFTLAPTTAPTSLLESFLASLPNSTQQRLLDPFSPQSSAYDWLSNHQNITNLEDWRKSQLFALATFFYSMDGRSWPEPIQGSWLNDATHECNWFTSGDGYFDEDGSFAAYEKENFQFRNSCNQVGEYELLRLNDLNLSITAPFIPPEIVLLTSLKGVWLPSIGLAQPLSEFLPQEFYSMPNLTTLSLNDNSLFGPIPSSFGLMPRLHYLDLYLNHLTGTIPSELGRTQGLHQLYLTDNHLSGTIPTELGALQLLELGLSLNPSLTGTIPTELGLLSHLWLFGATGCSFTGTIPSQLGQWGYSLWFNLQSNSLTGTIPTELGMLAQSYTQGHEPGRNLFSSWQPLFYGDQQIVFEIDFGSNLLTGWLPTELGLVDMTFGLQVNDNRLTGPIPTELGQLYNLGYAHLQGNAWTGTLPSELGRLDNLLELVVADANLTGSVPLEIASLVESNNLSLFAAGGNYLTGIIPEPLCALNEVGCYYNRSAPRALSPDWKFGGMSPCLLSFDCNDQLCGCSCSCHD